MPQVVLHAFAAGYGCGEACASAVLGNVEKLATLRCKGTGTLHPVFDVNLLEEDDDDTSIHDFEINEHHANFGVNRAFAMKSTSEKNRT